jgi:uncharacterized membrane protein
MGNAMKISHRNKELSVQTRILISFFVGLIASTATILLGLANLAPITLFDVSVLIYGIWTWCDIWPMNAKETARHALREDPSHPWTDVFLTSASLVSLIAVGFLIAGAGSKGGKFELLFVGFGIISVVLSWSLVHTIFALRYARMYYGDPEGGIDFNQKDKPTYSDFAYMSFTIGMTFQVSDTEFQTQDFRKSALRHSLLAYIFGTVIVATTINLVAGLSK